MDRREDQGLWQPLFHIGNRGGRGREASAASKSKGKIQDEDGGVVMFINEEKVCEVPGTMYHTLPSRQKALLFLGSLRSPPVRAEDLHLPANMSIKNVSASEPHGQQPFKVESAFDSLQMAGYGAAAEGVVRLTYFSGYGLAEQTRWMLAAAKISFEQATFRAFRAPFASRSK